MTLFYPKENFSHLLRNHALLTPIAFQILHWQSPHFHGYYPHGYSFVAYLADMLAHGVGSVMFSWVSVKTLMYFSV